MKEVEIYDYIYNRPGDYPKYGKSNHGFESYKLFKDEFANSNSIIDIGCGYNNFINGARRLRKSKYEDWMFLGVDFACPGADIIADAARLPINNKIFDTLTSFDVLEHIAPQNIEKVLSELKRVSCQFIFSIAYRKAGTTVPGVENLHLTVESEEWWLDVIGKHCKEINTRGPYIYGTWNDNKNNKLCNRLRKINLVQTLIAKGTNKNDMYYHALCWLIYQSIRDRTNHFDNMSCDLNYSTIFSISSIKWKLSIICALIFYLIVIESDFLKAYEICKYAKNNIIHDQSILNDYTFCNISKIAFIHYILARKLDAVPSLEVERKDTLKFMQSCAKLVDIDIFLNTNRWDVTYIWSIMMSHIYAVEVGAPTSTVSSVRVDEHSRFYPTLKCFEKIIQRP